MCMERWGVVQVLDTTKGLNTALYRVEMWRGIRVTGTLLLMMWREHTDCIACVHIMENHFL